MGLSPSFRQENALNDLELKKCGSGERGGIESPTPAAMTSGVPCFSKPDP